MKRGPCDDAGNGMGGGECVRWRGKDGTRKEGGQVVTSCLPGDCLRCEVPGSRDWKVPGLWLAPSPSLFVVSLPPRDADAKPLVPANASAQTAGLAYEA